MKWGQSIASAAIGNTRRRRWQTARKRCGLTKRRAARQSKGPHTACFQTPGVSLAFMGFRRDNGEPIDWSPIIVGPKLRAQTFGLVPGRRRLWIRGEAGASRE
jgi:hypothetical protein